MQVSGVKKTKRARHQEHHRWRGFLWPIRRSGEVESGERLKSGDSSRHVWTYKSGTHKIPRISGVFRNPETSKSLDGTCGSCFVIAGSLDPFAPGMLKSYKRVIKSWSIINAGSLFDVQLLYPLVIKHAHGNPPFIYRLVYS